MADNVVSIILPSTGLTISQWVNEITTIDCTSGLTAAINCANTNTFLVNLFDNASPHTFTLSNLKVGQTVKVTIVQGSTTPSTVTWAGQTIRWTDNNTTPTLATDTGHADEIVLYGASGPTVPGNADMIGGTLALANF